MDVNTDGLSTTELTRLSAVLHQKASDQGLSVEGIESETNQAAGHSKEEDPNLWEQFKQDMDDAWQIAQGKNVDDKGWVDEKGRYHVRTCFVAGTLIHTRDGLKKIEDIRMGDSLLSWNEKTKEQSYRKVSNTFQRTTNMIYTIRYQDGTVFETTWNHPFYIEGKGFIQVKNLEVGDYSYKKDGQLLKISFISKTEQEKVVYNFEVAENHTYYVGEAGILVHNDNGYNKVEKLEYKKDQGILSSIGERFSNLFDGNGFRTNNSIIERNLIKELLSKNDPESIKKIAEMEKFGIEGFIQRLENFIHLNGFNKYIETKKLKHITLTTKFPEPENDSKRWKPKYELTDSDEIAEVKKRLFEEINNLTDTTKIIEGDDKFLMSVQANVSEETKPNSKQLLYDSLIDPARPMDLSINVSSFKPTRGVGQESHVKAHDEVNVYKRGVGSKKLDLNLNFHPWAIADNVYYYFMGKDGKQKGEPFKVEWGVDNPKLLEEYMPLKMIIAHELIHVANDNRGFKYYDEDLTTYYKQLKNPKLKENKDIITYAAGSYNEIVTVEDNPDIFPIYEKDENGEMEPIRYPKEQQRIDDILEFFPLPTTYLLNRLEGYTFNPGKLIRATAEYA